MCSNDFRVKRSKSQCIDYWNRFMLHHCFPLTAIITKLHTQSPIEFRMCPNVPRSKGQGHNALISVNGLCCIIPLPFHLSSWNFISTLLTSLRGPNWKVNVTMHWLLRMGFDAYDCFPFTHIIVTLHTETSFELRMCTFGFRVKTYFSFEADGQLLVVVKLYRKQLHNAP